MSEKLPFRDDPSTGTNTVRYVHEPTAIPMFRSLSRIWHFPSGTVRLELRDRRDCLLPDIDWVELPANECHRVGAIVALETDTTARVVEEQGDTIVTEFDNKIIL
jgi:hypothetical protein